MGDVVTLVEKAAEKIDFSNHRNIIRPVDGDRDRLAGGPVKRGHQQRVGQAVPGAKRLHRRIGGGAGAKVTKT